MIELTARQWEAIAAAQQYRLFAIHDTAVNMLSPTPDPDVPEEDAPYRNIIDLCKLPYKALIKKGLLKEQPDD